MPTQTEDDKASKRNPSQADYERRVGALSSAEKKTFEGIVSPENLARDGTPDSLAGAVRKAEETPGFKYTGTGNQQSRPNFISRMSGNKKWLASGGITVGLISIPVIFMSLLPLKLDMFIKNITNLASSVPNYATEQRLNYIITRAIATRLLMAADGTSEADGKLVFCRTGGIACSLFTTYSNDYFERKLGITFQPEANGRASLGGRATSWNLNITDADGRRIEGPMSRISSHSEMRALIKAEVHSKSKKTQIITRYLSRKLLMKKFGVTSWRGPPKVEHAIDSLVNARTNIKTSLIKNTIGKITPRLATYLTCLQGNTAVCSKLRTELSRSITVPDDPSKSPDFDPDNADDRRALREFERARASKAAIEGVSEVVEEGANGGLKRIISKKVLAMVGGAGALAGVLDLVFSAVGSIEEGGLEEIWYDMSTQTYAGFATEIVTIRDKQLAGDLDLDTIGAAVELLDNAESNPLEQAESGQLVDTSTGIVAQCDGSNDQKVNTQLEPGELVCPEQRIIRDYSSSFTSNAGWSALQSTAQVWNDSVGVAFDWVGGVVGTVLETIPGFKQLMSWAGGAAEPAINWIMGLVFDPPATGYEESGSDNYTALSGGIRTIQNSMFEEGVDTDGTAMGGGGTVLTNEQAAAVGKEYENGEREYFENQPMMARIFDLELTGSFAQHFISMLPTSISSLARLPSTAFGYAFSGSSVSAATSSNTVNPFNLPLYGYGVGDSALTADPSVYTEASCAASAKAREDSRRQVDSVSMVSVYTVADPCALEKMVVGSTLNAEGVTDDPYSLQDPTTNSRGNSSVPQTTGQVVSPVAEGFRLTSNFGPRAKPCSTCSSWHEGQDISNHSDRTVKAVMDGTVLSVKNGGNNDVKIKHSDGLISVYKHMFSNDIVVKAGDVVTAGQKIGLIGDAGDSVGAHLHFELDISQVTAPADYASYTKNTKGTKINPREFLAQKGVAGF